MNVKCPQLVQEQLRKEQEEDEINQMVVPTTATTIITTPPAASVVVVAAVASYSNNNIATMEFDLKAAVAVAEDGDGQVWQERSLDLATHLYNAVEKAANKKKGSNVHTDLVEVLDFPIYNNCYNDVMQIFKLDGGDDQVFEAALKTFKAELRKKAATRRQVSIGLKDAIIKRYNLSD